MKYSPELQIQIDDVYACPGSCPGCILAANERKSLYPDMSQEIMNLSFEKLGEYVKTLKDIDSINITFGIADHLRMEDDYLKKIHKFGNDLITKDANLTNEKSAVFFTTSLIGKAKLLIPRLEKIANHNLEIPYYPIAVLDPAKLYNGNFGAIYEGNILKTKEIFGKVDLAINLSEEAINKISPKALHDFAADNGFSEITVNWTPTPGNIKYTGENLEYLAKWLIDFDNEIEKNKICETSYSPVLKKAIDTVLCISSPENLPELKQVLNEILNETFKKSIEIDHLGNLLPKLEAVGDITYGDRFKLPDFGHLSTDSIKNLLEKSIPRTQMMIMGIYSKMPNCMNCKHLPICATTGFHVHTHVLKNNKNRQKCPHVASELFDHFLEERIQNDLNREKLSA